MRRTTMIAAMAALASASAVAAPTEVVLVQANQSGTEGMFIESPSGSGDLGANVETVGDRICANRDLFRRAIGLPTSIDEARDSLGAVGTVLGNVGILPAPQPEPTYEQVEAGVLFDEFCAGREESATYNIIYTDCSMTMWNNDRWVKRTLIDPDDPSEGYKDITYEFLRFVLPSDGGPAEMQFFEFTDIVPGPSFGFGPALRRLKLERVFGQDTGQYVPKGELIGNVEVRRQGGSRQLLGVQTKGYAFKYEGEMSPAMMPAQYEGESFPIGRVHLVSEGTAWMYDQAPGAHVIRQFYRNFERQVVHDESSGTLLGGMIAHLARLSEHGVPLQLEQSTAVRIQGLPTLGQASRHEMTVKGMVNFFSEADWCQALVVPEDWQIIEMDDLSDMYGGQATADAGQPGAAATGGSSPAGGAQADAAAAMSEAMSAMEQAMQQMTPEQQQMLQNMGIPGMPQSGGQAASAGTNAGSSGAQKSSTPTGRTAGGSDSLMADSVDGSVRNHLDALGYDTGDSAMGLTIAISQFQAEKGMAVNGQVSPQLLGVLAAEVDARGGN